MASRNAHRGFTLVEILIVVVILGILATLVIGNFTSTVDETTKSTLLRQLQHIENQVELYRASNGGQLPSTDAGAPLGTGESLNGWGILVSENYLREQPWNPYTASTLLVAGDEAAARAVSSSGSEGWFYEFTGASITFHAAGYDATANELFHEMSGGG